MAVDVEADAGERMHALLSGGIALFHVPHANHGCTPNRRPSQLTTTAPAVISAITIVTYADRMLELPPSHMSSTSTANTSVPGAVKKIDAAYSRNERSAT